VGTRADGRLALVAAVHLLLVRDGEILLLRRFNTGYEDGNYSVPAGHLDGGERVTEAMAREAREETGVRLDPAALDVVHVMHRRAVDPVHERVDFFLTTSRWAGDPVVLEPDKCDELSWHAMDRLPHNTVPYVRAAIGAFSRGERYSEFGWR
jgi:8-oxo-dGTP diphosphatase